MSVEEKCLGPFTMGSRGDIGRMGTCPCHCGNVHCAWLGVRSCPSALGGEMGWESCRDEALGWMVMSLARA